MVVMELADNAERAIEPRIARRRAEEKRADTLFVCERRRRRRVPSAIRSERSEQSSAERAVQQSSLRLVSVDVQDRQMPAGRAHAVTRRILRWYASHARDLPWRRPGVTPWAIMVSEFMLQQTPVERVRGPWQSWVERWPTPASLAAATPGEAVRSWGRLGYPRRALRLHQAAQVITNDFNGQVPEDRELLLSLPGVGSYTASAIASFAYGRREIVLDTNVRRVLARIGFGQAFPTVRRERASGHWPRSSPLATRHAPPVGQSRSDGARRISVPRS